MTVRFIPPIGTHANAWNAAAVAAAGVSAIVDTYSCPHVTVFGHASAATTITLQYSADGVNFYAGPSTVLAGASDFYINCYSGAQFTRLSSSAAATVTGTIQAA